MPHPPKPASEAPSPRKEMISIRLDRDLLAFFRSTGPGWQSKINAVLRAYVEAAAKR